MTMKWMALTSAALVLSACASAGGDEFSAQQPAAGPHAASATPGTPRPGVIAKPSHRQYFDQRRGRYYYFDPATHRYYWEDGQPRY